MNRCMLGVAGSVQFLGQKGVGIRDHTTLLRNPFFLSPTPLIKNPLCYATPPDLTGPLHPPFGTVLAYFSLLISVFPLGLNSPSPCRYSTLLMHPSSSPIHRSMRSTFVFIVHGATGLPD